MIKSFPPQKEKRKYFGNPARFLIFTILQLRAFPLSEIIICSLFTINIFNDEEVRANRLKMDDRICPDLLLVQVECSQKNEKFQH